MIMFIIDEASIIPIHALHAIDRLLQDITGVTVPFGGKIFLLGGDFRQVLPVMPHGSRTSIVENCLKRSPLWKHFVVIKLTENMRAHKDQHNFADWLLRLGEGKLKCARNVNIEDSIEIPSSCIVADLIDSIFDDICYDMTKRVILTPKNDASLQLNSEVLKKLPGTHHVYLSMDKVICDNEEEQQNYPREFLNSLTPSEMPEHHLCLKIGAIIMLLRNLDISNGLCNGTRLIVRNMYEHLIDAEAVTNRRQRVLIPRIKLAPSDSNLPFVLERCQIPVRLAYLIKLKDKPLIK